MEAFLEIKKLESEDIITTSVSNGLTNGGAGDAGDDNNSGNWDEAETVTLLD